MLKSTPSLPMARSPAGIAERQDAALGAAAGGEIPEDVYGRRQRHIVADQHRVVLHIVGRMQHEAAAGLDRAAEMHADLLAAAVRADIELLQQFGEGEGADPAIDHQAHRTGRAVGAHIDHRARETGIAHLRHGDQKLPREIAFRPTLVRAHHESPRQSFQARQASNFVHRRLGTRSIFMFAARRSTRNLDGGTAKSRLY
jgi:hypothetical protein